MNGDTPDQDLVRRYTREGSETAFGALVSRHVHLVYGAAFRQVGDAGMAEEITQNVFIALARKAPRLAGHETLAGWLHRTAILESKARLRSELRRQRREDVAGVLDQLRQSGRAPMEDLSPILDEGLLQLREPDRLALILRYLEERSLREVGRLLGVEEDAARKRVERALERLSAFFRSRGFSVPSGAGASVAVLSKAAAAVTVPANVVPATIQAGVAAGAVAGTVQPTLFLLSLMKLSTVQTAGLCALLVATPLAWQWYQRHDLETREQQVTGSLARAREELERIEGESGRLRRQLIRDQAAAFNALHRPASGPLPAKGNDYQWDDQSPVARVPKELFRTIQVPAVTNRSGTLSPVIRAALQMTEAESAAVQGSLNTFLTQIHAAQARVVREVPAKENERARSGTEQVRVFEINGIGDEVTGIRDSLLSQLDTTLGSERSTLFKQSLGSWIPMDSDSPGMNGGWSYLNGDYRIQFYNTSGDAAGRPWLRWGLSKEGSAFSSMIPVDDIPPYLQQPLQDWIQEARGNAADANRRNSP